VTRAGGPNGTGAYSRSRVDGTSFKLLHAFAPVTSEASAAGRSTSTEPRRSACCFGSRWLPVRHHVVGGERPWHDFPCRHRWQWLSAATRVRGVARLESPPANVGGASPLAGLTDGKDGRFYGVASGGGANGVGTIFSFDPVARLFSVMHNFEDSNGDTPAGAMILGLDTRLYGTRPSAERPSGGGKSTLGTIFSIARDGTVSPSCTASRARRAPIHGPAAADERHDADRRCARWRQCSQGTIYQLQFDRCHVTGDTGCGQKKRTRAAAPRRPRYCCCSARLGLRAQGAGDDARLTPGEADE